MQRHASKNNHQNRASFVALLLLGAYSLYGQGNSTPDELAPDSRITSVMLAGGQALVTRTGRVQLPAGKHAIVFKRLPAELTDASLRFGFSTEERILEIRVEQVTTTEIPDEEANEAEENLRKAQARLRELTDEYKGMQEMEGLTRGITSDSTEKKWDDKTDRLSPAQWRRSIDFVEQMVGSLQGDQRDVKRNIIAAEEDVQVALVIAERMLSRRNLVSKQARILVQSNGSQSDFSLSYRTPGAVWYPSYSVRVGKSEKDNVKLAAFALVENRTGEEWQNVKLQLSASNPEDLISLPELREWRIRTAMVAEQTTSMDKRRQNANEAQRPMPAQAQSISRDRMAREEEESNAEARLDTTGIQNQPAKPSVDDGLNKTVNSSRNTLKESQNITAAKDTGLLQLLNERDRAFKSGFYDQAARYSEDFLGKFGNLRTENQKLFAAEEKNSRDIREKSLTAIQNKSPNLIAPRQLRGGAVYETQYSETIPSDGILRKVSLFEVDLVAQKIYECVPVHQPFGYLTGHIKYKNDKPLLPGPAQVFHGDDFTGEAILPEVGNNQDFALALGSTEDIKVTRIENRFQETAGLLSGDLLYHVEIQIKIKNAKRESVTLDAYDRVPVSEDDRIKIEDKGVNIQPAQRTPEGLMRFRLEVGPGSEQIITFKYNLRHSKEITPSASDSGAQL
ncbi:MAG: DUF4139 domain-containing protein [Spirochaetia bacterium]|nr:DUF4139 domain-containing protein [Spirochaetia bacterium]